MQTIKQKKELIDYFENGEQRYSTSPLFHIAIDWLIRGKNPHEVIDTLITMCEDTQKRFCEYVKHDTRPFIIAPNHTDLERIKNLNTKK